jgi:hypothetical protein
MTTESETRVVGDRVRPGALRTALNLLTGRQASLERLRAEIEPVSTEIGVRRGERSAAERGSTHWLDGAEQQVRNARRAVEDGEPEVGWRNLLQARRLLVHGNDPDTTTGRNELRARAAAVRTEAEEKLDGWRLDAVRELLAPPAGALDGSAGSGDDGPGEPRAGSGAPSGEPWTPTPEAIYSAAEILDARHGNVHRRVALVRKQVLALVLVEFVGVLGVLWVATYWQSPFAAAAGSASLLVSVALFGLMGASAGRLVSLVTASSPEKLPVLAIHWWVTVGRTLMGAAAALALYAFVHSGVVAVGGVGVDSPAFQALVLAIAFAAGFSERLLERAVGAVGGSDEKRTSPERPDETPPGAESRAR